MTKREVYGMLANGDRIYLGVVIDDDNLGSSQNILDGFTDGGEWFNIGSFVYNYEAFIGLQITPQYPTRNGVK